MTAYETRMHELLQPPLQLVPGKINELAPRILRLSPDAKTLLTNFADHIERQIGPVAS